MTANARPGPRSLRGLDWLNFFLADVQTGIGPFLAIYLARSGWNEQWVGAALSVSGLAGIVFQTPAGALVDRLHAKRGLLAGAVLALAAAAGVIAFLPRVWPVMLSQVLIGASSTVFIPGICAMSLGLVGASQFDRRQGRNQAFNSAGNVVAALSMGLIALCVSDAATFLFVAAAAIPTLLALAVISPDEIDYARSRGAEGSVAASGFRHVPRRRQLAIFLVCAVLFHFANAAMLPLLGEMLAKGKGRESMLFMSACVITTQTVVSFVSGWAGIKAGAWGRKPLLLIAFSALPLRGLLYTLVHGTAWLVGVQVLDGIGVGIFNVVSVLVIADLTRGSGRFNLALGAITTAVGIGAALSQGIAGALVLRIGYRGGFLFLSAIAAAALAILFLFMAESRRPPRHAPP